MKTTHSKLYKQRMLGAIKSKIRHYEKCLSKLPNLDSEVFAAGMKLFDDGESFAIWLCAPQAGLGGKIPLNVMTTATGRKEVTRILSAINYGVYL